MLQRSSRQAFGLRWACALLLAGFLTPLRAETPPTLSESGLALARRLQATRMGVDRAGNLWTWEAQGGAIHLYSQHGAELAGTRVPEALDVDVDREWGVASIVSQGFELRLKPFTEDLEVSVKLSNRAGGVAWIGPHTVAVSQSLAAHRVEIWDVQKKALLRTLGTETALQPGPGVTVLRKVHLKYVPQQDLLYTLESFTGDLQVFSLDGKLVQKERLPLGDRKALEQSLSEEDREKKARNEISTPFITWFRMAVDDSGTFWSIKDCDKQGGKATFLRIPVRGKLEVLEVAEPCCSKSLALWGGWLIFYSDPALPRPSCNNVRRLP